MRVCDSAASFASSSSAVSAAPEPGNGRCGSWMLTFTKKGFRAAAAFFSVAWKCSRSSGGFLPEPASVSSHGNSASGFICATLLMAAV